MQMLPITFLLILTVQNKRKLTVHVFVLFSQSNVLLANPWPYFEHDYFAKWQEQVKTAD